jgi:PAB1-binding protein PBP1
LTNLILELQAAGEAYSEDYRYYKTEKDVRLALLSHEKAKEELQPFNDSYKEYEKDLRRQKRRKAGAVTDDMRAFMEEELPVDDIALEREPIQDAVDLAKEVLSETKTIFAEEKKKEENCKGTGQPLHAEIDSILQRHGIDRVAKFGGALAGNGC